MVDFIVTEPSDSQLTIDYLRSRQCHIPSSILNRIKGRESLSVYIRGRHLTYGGNTRRYDYTSPDDNTRYKYVEHRKIIYLGGE